MNALPEIPEDQPKGPKELLEDLLKELSIAANELAIEAWTQREGLFEQDDMRKAYRAARRAHLAAGDLRQGLQRLEDWLVTYEERQAHD